MPFESQASELLSPTTDEAEAGSAPLALGPFSKGRPRSLEQAFGDSWYRTRVALQETTQKPPLPTSLRSELLSAPTEKLAEPRCEPTALVVSPGRLRRAARLEFRLVLAALLHRHGVEDDGEIALLVAEETASSSMYDLPTPPWQTLDR